MEKTKVTFKREVFGLKEDRTLIDSPKNIKVMAKYYTKLLNTVAEDEEKDDPMKQFVAGALELTDIVLECATELLALSKEGRQKLENRSFAPMFETFKEMLLVCLGVDMGLNNETDEEEKDPKFKPEKPSGN